MTMPPEFLLYLHIQKTAGITLQRVLRRKLGRSVLQRLFAVFRREPRPQGIVASLKEEAAAANYFTAHMCYGGHELVGRNCRYMTFLRHPVSRLISLYQYSVTNESAYYHRHAAGKTPEQFLLDSHLHELDNGQVRFLAGGDPNLFINRTPFGQCSPELLDLAQRHIEEHFCLVGLTEMFDESFLLLCRHFGWRQTYYLSRNQSRGVQVKVDESIRQEVARRNSLDIKLYEFARARLEQQIADSGIVQNGQLASFRRNNERFQNVFGPLYGGYSMVKRLVRGTGDQPA